MPKSSFLNTIFLSGLLGLGFQSCNWDDRYYNYFIDNEDIDLKAHVCEHVDAIYYDINSQNNYKCTYTTETVPIDKTKVAYIKQLTECNNQISVNNDKAKLSEEQIELFKTAILKNLCPYDMICTKYPGSGEDKSSFGRCVYPETLFDCGSFAHFYMNSENKIPCEKDDANNCGEHGKVCKVNDAKNEVPICINKKCAIKCPNTHVFDETSGSCKLKECTKDQDCEMSHASYHCKNSHCEFSCQDPYIFNNTTGSCTTIKCGTDNSICQNNLIPHAKSGECVNETCTFTCNPEFALCGSSCYSKEMYGLDDYCQCNNLHYVQCGFMNEQPGIINNDLVPRCLKIDWDTTVFSDPAEYCDLLCSAPQTNEYASVTIDGKTHRRVYKSCTPTQHCIQSVNNNGFEYSCKTKQ